MALQLFQTGSNSPINSGFSLKGIKWTKFDCFFFLLQCGTSSMWKYYVTLEIVNHHSIQPQTNKESVPAPVCLSTRSGGGQGGVFPI